MNREEIQTARLIVVAAIQNNSDCFRPDISREAQGRVSEGALSQAISELVKESVIRMREDPYEHDWEYVLTARALDADNDGSLIHLVKPPTTGD